MASLEWNMTDVDAKTKQIMENLNQIVGYTDGFDNNNKKYYSQLKDQISSEVEKCILQIQKDVAKMLVDVQKINGIIHQANIYLQKTETENPIHN